MIYVDVYKYIQELGNKINELYKIDPKVYLVFSNKNKVIEGLCQPMYKASQMYISIIIPYNYTTFGKKRQLEVASTLIHEYAHYVTELSFTGKERMKYANAYAENQLFRRCTEQSNWTMTKHLAEQLGMWNKHFYTVCKESYYTSNLKYN